MLVGEGFAKALSPDGSRVLSVAAERAAAALPPADRARAPASRGRIDAAGDSRRSCGPTGFRTASASSSPEPSPGTASRLYACDPRDRRDARDHAARESSSITTRAFPVSPDGKRVAAVLLRRPARGLSDRGRRGPADSRTSRPARSRSPGRRTAAGSSSIGIHGVCPLGFCASIRRPAERELWKELLVPDAGGRARHALGADDRRTGAPTLTPTTGRSPSSSPSKACD